MKKQSSVALALVMTTAGVASALAPVPRPIETLMTSAPRPTRESVARNASFEIRQAPVPLLVKARPPIEQPIFDADAVGPSFVATLVVAKASDRFGESAPKSAIEAVGLVANCKDAPGANGRCADSHPTAGGTRWAP